MPATRNLRSHGPVDDDDGQANKRPVTRATKAKAVNPAPPATERPRPRKVNKTRPVRDPDEVFLSNRRWSSASHTGSGNSERDD
ncbi:hypothetical protein H0H92_000707, partial [Tricholoma furcatifolium]